MMPPAIDRPRAARRTTTPRIAVVGAGWSGSVAARQLHDTGFQVEVYEAHPNVGGHSRTELLNGVVYEPNGAHIFHTSNPAVARYVGRFGLKRPYAHCVLTEVFLPDDDKPLMLSWPPQVDELRNLPMWARIEKEIANLPPAPSGNDFESFVISLMGPTLYGLFIRDYTTKQWGMNPTELSSSFAPKRVELRRDGYRRLFRETWEFFPARGVNSVIEAILRPIRVTCGVALTAVDVSDLEADAIVVTAPLDDFAGCPGELAWRGITMRSTFHPTDDVAATMTPAYVVNRPSARVAYTRTVETKHATGQRIRGTVVSEEYPGAPARHYPVPTVGRTYEQRNEALKQQVRSASTKPIFFCGRLANYQYINQDQAIEQAFACADEVRRFFA
jgi:UDP-galactopyranose mutase